MKFVRDAAGVALIAALMVHQRVVLHKATMKLAGRMDAMQEQAERLYPQQMNIEQCRLAARWRIRCSVFVKRAKPSSSARSSFVSVIGVASGMPLMHPLNHDSTSRNSGY